MDASQYKDNVPVLLFITYVSDKYAGVPFAPIAIPVGAGFRDMVALKGRAATQEFAVDAGSSAVSEGHVEVPG